MNFDEFENKASELIKKSENSELLTEGEKMFLAQYIYEDYVPFDGFLLTYLNTTEEVLSMLLQAYEMIQDNENLSIVKSFSELVKKIDRQEEFENIVGLLTEKEVQLLENWDSNFPKGSDDYTKSFELLLGRR